MDTKAFAYLDAHDRSQPPGHGKIADIEVLRGISILFVLEAHAHATLLTWPLPWMTYVRDHYFALWPGVDLFLAISGFVIARTLIPRLEEARDTHEFLVAVLAFWLRRVWRLLPSAWLWLGIILLGAAFFNTSGHFGLFHANFESVVAAVLSLANVHFAAASNYLTLGASAHYWSLSLEEQFYFGLPLLIFVARRHLPAALAATTAIFFVLPENSAWAATFRLQPILLGVALALLARQRLYWMLEPRFLANSRLLRACCLVLPLSLMASQGPLLEEIVPYRFDVIAILAAGLVFIASYGKDYTLEGGALRHVLVWFGSRSYALYLIHNPVFSATNELFYRISPAGTVFGARFTPWFLLVGLGATLALAELNYRLIEQTLRRRGARLARSFEARHCSGK